MRTNFWAGFVMGAICIATIVLVCDIFLSEDPQPTAVVPPKLASAPDDAETEEAEEGPDPYVMLMRRALAARPQMRPQDWHSSEPPTKFWITEHDPEDASSRSFYAERLSPGKWELPGHWDESMRAWQEARLEEAYLNTTFEYYDESAEDVDVE